MTILQIIYLPTLEYYMYKLQYNYSTNICVRDVLIMYLVHIISWQDYDEFVRTYLHGHSS